MSEAEPQRMKVSREGVVLIKSFEGFRPRAVARDGGGWTIGYGHTLSAREGATVGESDAELLLQYDLIPIVQAVTRHAGADLNQHQFDALASFAFSVGVEAFAASDVVRRLREGSAAQAADALVGWPQPLPPDAALRRRAAERALFMAEPGAVVTLAQLLSAPLPPPAVPDRAPFTAPAVAEPAPEVSRAAALAVLLGEAEPPPVIPDMSGGPTAAEPESPAPSDTAAAADVALEPADETAPPAPSNDIRTTPAYAPPAAVAGGVSFSGPLLSAVRTPSPVTAQTELTPPVANDAVDTPVEAETPTLVLTPPPETEALAPVRAPWPEERRFADAAAQDALFEDGASGAVMRAEPEDPPAPRGWNESAPFVIMGGIGLVSFGAAMAAFRRAAQEDGGDIALIGWVLAVIALVCVGVSGFNLYQRLGRGSDASGTEG